MENTLANKAKVLALYFGVKVWRNSNYKVGSTYLVDSNSLDYAFLSILVLKPISSISDEDAIAVANIIYNGYYNQYYANPEKVKMEPEYCYTNSFEVADYLRSKGYALPAFGLSVEELVNRGWYVLEK